MLFKEVFGVCSENHNDDDRKGSLVSLVIRGENHASNRLLKLSELPIRNLLKRILAKHCPLRYRAPLSPSAV